MNRANFKVSVAFAIVARRSRRLGKNRCCAILHGCEGGLAQSLLPRGADCVGGEAAGSDGAQERQHAGLGAEQSVEGQLTAGGL